jgi:hypothetical protein
MPAVGGVDGGMRLLDIELERLHFTFTPQDSIVDPVTELTGDMLKAW